MINNFPAFAKIVAFSFQRIAKVDAVFVTAVEPDALYEKYLAAFPSGTNPLFKKRTEHDCSCCRQFVRRVGNVISVDDEGRVHTVWDEAVEKAPHPYNVVSIFLRDAVLDADISNLFRVSVKETNFGAEQTRSFDEESSRAVSWDHFYTGPIPATLRHESPDQIRGDYRTTVQVFERGLTELTPDAVETVLGLVDANNLYRGEEHRSALVQFQQAQRAFLRKTDAQRRIFAWTNAHGPAARFRNTVIGTLVQDLSEGKDVEFAVKAFETKVAPQNYKRTTAVITPIMVAKAMETIESLGLQSALERRFAVIGDISVNDVKWVDNVAKPLMKGGIGDVLMQHAVATNPKVSDDVEKRAEEIGLDAFVQTILPETTGMELLFKSEHLGNLMSLTAPAHPEPKQLFRWDNDFAWSYCGNVADSIKERVKKAGGKVDGAVLRVSLSWFNYDDLDLHVHQPPGRGVAGLTDHIYYGSKRGWTGGVLDVDMNAGSGTTREPVENVSWSKIPPDGSYKVVVNNFNQRETSDAGFVIEVESGGKLSHFSYNKAVRNRQDIHVATLHLKAGVVERIEAGDPGITMSNVSQNKWGLKTEQFVKVNAVTLSPNYWGNNAVGNKHTFFLLDGASNDEPTRGIYNEFLHPRLEPHRKVFEVIGDKTKCQPVDGQLSGLGFSSSKPDSFIVRVRQGKKQRLFNVKVGVNAVAS